MEEVFRHGVDKNERTTGACALLYLIDSHCYGEGEGNTNSEYCTVFNSINTPITVGLDSYRAGRCALQGHCPPVNKADNSVAPSQRQPRTTSQRSQSIGLPCTAMGQEDGQASALMDCTNDIQSQVNCIGAHTVWIRGYNIYSMLLLQCEWDFRSSTTLWWI